MPRIHQITTDTIRLDASNGSRTLIGALLADLNQAIPRLDNPSDREALHDFRVAARRLRASLRGYGSVLQIASASETRTALGDIARTTGEARDAQVQLAWLHESLHDCKKSHTPGITMASDFFQHRMEAGYRSGIETVKREAPATLAGLADALSKPVPPHKTSMPEFIAKAIRQQGGTVVKRLGKISGAFDQYRVHRARIAVKRMRYLVEPTVKGFVFVRPLVDELEELQENLGRLHDLQLASQHVTNLTGSLDSARDERIVMLESQPSNSGFQPPAELSGLLHIATVARRQHGALFAEVAKRWLGDRRGELTNVVQTVADRVAIDGLAAWSSGS